MPAAPSVAWGSVGAALLALTSCHREPTYYQAAQPILVEYCVGCHHAGGVAPTPALDTFEHARAAADKIRLAIQNRDMPPWGADDSGYCGKWRDSRWMRDVDVQTLSKWTEHPEPGNPDNSRAPKPHAHDAFRASAALDMGGDHEPGLGPASYRCFLAGPPFPDDRTVTAFRVASTEPRSVEQVSLYALDSDAAEAAATALDAEDPALGYTCFGTSRVAGARLVTSWTWDSDITRYPRGYGVKIAANRKLVVQIHYNPIATGLGVPTRTRVELEVDEHAGPASFLSVSQTELSLSPRQTHVEARAMLAAPRDLRLLGVVPRMHSLGKTLELDRDESGAWKCTGNFDHWDFYRQRLFVLEEPLPLAKGQRLRVSCAYDTESRSEPTRAGEGIDAEECVAELLVADR